MATRYQRHPLATERRLGNALFLAQPEAGTLLRLNESYAALWHLLAAPTTLEEAQDTFRVAFPGLPAEELIEQVAEMFDELYLEGLLVELP